MYVLGDVRPKQNNLARKRGRDAICPEREKEKRAQEDNVWVACRHSDLDTGRCLWSTTSDTIEHTRGYDKDPASTPNLYER